MLRAVALTSYVWTYSLLRNSIDISPHALLTVAAFNSVVYDALLRLFIFWLKNNFHIFVN